MAPKPDLPHSLRRAAARAAGPRTSPPDARLLAAAHAGLLTDANTAKGTAGRKAVDAAKYARRLAARPELPAREALGHEVAGSRPRIASFFATDPPRLVIVRDVTLRDMQRAGTYMASVGVLVDVQRYRGTEWAQVARAFERRFRRWRPIAGLPLLSDPEAAVALAETLRAQDTEVIFDSGRSRPGRRRRTTSRRRSAA